jgi:hypothetical protein
MKRFWLGLFVLLIIGTLSSCSSTRILMQQAPKKAGEIPSLPALNSAEILQSGLEKHIFGPFPKLQNVGISSKRIVAENVFIEGSEIEEWKVQAGFGGKKHEFHIVFVTQSKTEDAPFIITQNFCPNIAVVPIDGITAPSGEYFDCSGDGILGSVFRYFFGRYITVPPYEMILNKGYNIAVMYPPEFVPDSSVGAPRVIDTLFEHDLESRTGALAIWASLSAWLAEELKTSTSTESVITYGHSRYGKTALIAAAMNNKIDGVIAHQSGTGGASILRDGTGESVAQIMENYPHWFSPNFANYADREETLPVDAHMLLALIAPRPVMLGNARRDVWSDPEGSFYAAKAATPAWQDFGKTGLTADRLDTFKPGDDIAFWLRPGTHGVVEEDWPAFLEFLDAHFKN